jgi:hypothetical protein
MAKKSLVLLMIAVLAVNGIFAQENEKPKTAFRVSAGVGGLIGGDLGGGAETSSVKEEHPYFGGGFYTFLDLTYVEASFGFLYGTGTWADVSMSIMNANIGLLGKYPFVLSERLSVFPLLGIDYQATISVRDEDHSNVIIAGEKYSALWFKLGGGLDFAITSKYYIRAEAMYGIRLENQAEKDAKDKANADILLGHGPTIRLAIGYMF